MSVLLTFGDSESNSTFKVSGKFTQESEFLRNMIIDCGNEEGEMVIPFPFEISNEDGFKRFYQFWETNHFQDKESMIVDLTNFINLADYMQMDDFKMQLFGHLKRKLGKLSVKDLSILLNPYGTDTHELEKNHKKHQSFVQILKNFYDKDKIESDFIEIE